MCRPPDRAGQSQKKRHRISEPNMQFVIAFVNWLEASGLGEFIRESE